jgi:hypothetical protein
MIDKPIADYPDTYRWWSQAVTNFALSPWRLFDVQCEAGIKFLDALLGVHRSGVSVPERDSAVPAPPIPGSIDQLEHAAADCARSGKALPREVYQVQNRGRIDWSRFPDWARPSDPELFEGSAHEG